jgi:hypothetical protein
VTLDPVSVRVSHLKGVHSLGDVRSLGDRANLGAEATRDLPSDQITSAFPETHITGGLASDQRSKYQRFPGDSRYRGTGQRPKYQRNPGVFIIFSVPVSLPPQETG